MVWSIREDEELDIRGSLPLVLGSVYIFTLIPHRAQQRGQIQERGPAAEAEIAPLQWGES